MEWYFDYSFDFEIEDSFENYINEMIQFLKRERQVNENIINFLFLLDDFMKTSNGKYEVELKNKGINILIEVENLYVDDEDYEINPTKNFLIKMLCISRNVDFSVKSEKIHVNAFIEL